MEINKDSKFKLVEYTTDEVVPNVEDDSLDTIRKMSQFTQSLRPMDSGLEDYPVSFSSVVLSCLTSNISDMIRHLTDHQDGTVERAAMLTVTEDGTIIRIDPDFEEAGFVMGYQPVEFLGEEEQLEMKKLFSKLMRDPEMVVKAMQMATRELEITLDQRKRYLMKSDAENKQMNDLLKDIEVLDDVGKSDDTPTEEAL